jgi:hypothetical protein
VESDDLTLVAWPHIEMAAAELCSLAHLEPVGHKQVEEMEMIKDGLMDLIWQHPGQSKGMLNKISVQQESQPRRGNGLQ